MSLQALDSDMGDEMDVDDPIPEIHPFPDPNPRSPSQTASPPLSPRTSQHRPDRNEATLNELDRLLERFTGLAEQAADANPGSADDAALRRLAQEIESLDAVYTQRAEEARMAEEAQYDERHDLDHEDMDQHHDLEREGAPSPEPTGDAPPPGPQLAQIPLSQIKEIKLTQEYAALLADASLDNEKHSALGAEDLHDLQHPSHAVLDLSDLALRLGLNLFIACRHASIKTYNEVVAGIRAVYPDIPILSYHLVKKAVVNLSGVRTVRFDMCVNSCTAFTGPRLDPAKVENRSCPKRSQPRFDPSNTKKDAQFATPDHADAASYRARATAKLFPEFNEKGFVDTVEDFVTGTDILNTELGADDICLMWSGDGFQLWELKKSDCYVYIWVLLDLPPNLRYKKQYVIPGAVIPGPNKPGCLDSFVFPGLYHIKALQREGLRIWNAAQKREYTAPLHVVFVTADMVAQAKATGLVGHIGKEGCRRYCG
ncbi:unnamed protein product [Peniophora sp. CBMAI 1063]|nr:unnamed protein product [Peniophora sp. CBMAI 1063]